jgi:glyoxylase-like metal-dependent hydrolase (beta-lactamase superfamily II)
MSIKQCFFPVIAIFLSVSSLCAQVFKNSQLQISKIDAHSWVIETSTMSSMFLIEGKDKALLIDTGTKCDSLDKIIQKITQKPLYVVITHLHGDHDGSIALFSDIYIHPADTVLLADKYKGKLHFVNDGYVFDLGGKKIEVVHTPAHTPGSIILLDKETRSCYTGDSFGSGQVWLQLKPYMTMQTYINSCNKMLDIMNNGIDSIYCGHYPYLKSALGIDHIITMKRIAVSIDNGTVKNAEPFPRKVSIGCDNPMIATEGKVAIVYDPEHIK